MSFFENLKLVCGWDILVLVILIGATAWFFVRRYQLNKEKKELQNRLSKK
ncbi:YebO family protein [Acetatifactor muris]|uniref:Uncharacterized protein n=1 Tax=Acetatifactor muris TaxID=879566 RepID=A0A2K4ZEQ6_9FIRM|nr:hypothetical protein [Acetatifactor muris]MCR2048550.1 YebO family protein [Acetatifactor muris]SOY28942.1 hypothetical protein AMURIS_01657 [Acetatifactor muris]